MLMANSERQSASPPPNKKVKWGVEEPSEYRPEAATMDNLGKEKESFRLFYDVSSLSHHEDGTQLLCTATVRPNPFALCIGEGSKVSCGQKNLH